MKERFEDNANGKAETADARAPLSSYLKRENHSAPSEGWAIFSSEGQTEQSRTPNLSVLKQIKNFLNSKSDESNVPFDSNAQNFRVDYPYYASDSEQSTPTVDDHMFHSTFSDSEASVDKETPDDVLNSSEIYDVETDPSTHDKTSVLSREPYESADVHDAPSPAQESKFDCGLTLEDEKNVRKTEEVDLPLNSLSSHENENDSSPPSVAPQETLKEDALQQTQSSTPFQIDVAEILGSDFSQRWEPALCDRIEEGNKTFETESEKRFVPTPTSPQERASTTDVASVQSRDTMPLAIAYPAQFNTARRRDTRSKLAIFHRFVDLATAHKQTPTNVDEILQNKPIDADVHDDSREICVCAPYESANSVEVVVAPCYVGANLTFQNQ